MDAGKQGSRTRAKIFKAAVSAFVLLAVFVALWGFFLSAGKPNVLHRLPDGSTVQLMQVATGKALRFYWGKWWQRPIFRMFGTNVPDAVTGGGTVLPSMHEAGSLGIFVRRISHNALSTVVESESGALAVIGHDGAEIQGVCRTTATVVDESLNTHLKLSVDSIWELPIIKGPHLTMRYYPRSGETNFVTLSIRNPIR